jgi:hypothetical protein
MPGTKLDGMVLVSKEWYERMLERDTADQCPFCGAVGKVAVQKTEGFYPRRGCLECNEWWEPVVAK